MVLTFVLTLSVSHPYMYNLNLGVLKYFMNLYIHHTKSLNHSHTYTCMCDRMKKVVSQGNKIALTENIYRITN